MNKRKSTEEWMSIIGDYLSSGINLTAWCRNNGISKSSMYPYINKFNKASKPLEQLWCPVSIPKIKEPASISLKIGLITLDIKPGFEKEVLAEVLSVVM